MILGPLPNIKLKTSATSEKPLEASQNGEQVKSFKVEHKLFSRLLIVSRTRTENIKNVPPMSFFQHPSIFYQNYELQKSAKSKLFHEFEIVENWKLRQIGNSISATVSDAKAIVQCTIQKNMEIFCCKASSHLLFHIFRKAVSLCWPLIDIILNHQQNTPSNQGDNEVLVLKFISVTLSKRFDISYIKDKEKQWLKNFIYRDNSNGVLDTITHNWLERLERTNDPEKVDLKMFD